jgi:formamidopyrimidine-DNA glycosylase
MLEIPEAATISRQITETFKGFTVIAVEAAHTPHGFAFYNHSPQEYSELLEGKTLEGACATGGQVDIGIGDMHLVFNDGVNARLHKAGELMPKRYQFYIEFADAVDASEADVNKTEANGIVCTVQMYGGFNLYPNGVTDNKYYNIARDLPSPLSNAFDKEYFDGIISRADPKLSAKALLATEQRIPGLGNGVLQDILFSARVNPQKKLRDMAQPQIDALYSSVKAVLSEMVAGGGRDTEKDLFGNPGGYRTILSAKTKDSPCPDCGGPITRKAYLGGNVYFCAHCQSM